MGRQVTQVFFCQFAQCLNERLRVVQGRAREGIGEIRLTLPALATYKKQMIEVLEEAPITDASKCAQVQDGWYYDDKTPWGQIVHHYGRWFYHRNAWCWAPGTYVARPVYAPALVAWIGGPQELRPS